MKEVQPVKAKVNQSINHFGEQVTPEEIFVSRLANPAETGWWFPAGDPEFWRFSDKLLVPGRHALDIGVGFGRTSLFFALNGMNVTGYETDENALRFMTALKEGYDLPIELVAEDIKKADFGRNRYDTVLLGQTFVHFPSKKDAFSVIQKAIEATKPGGHVWIRVGGKEGSAFEELQMYADVYPEIARMDEDVFMAPCSCSGELKTEPQLFFDPMELLNFLAQKGLKIVHTQIIPEKGRQNIMFGEDWNPNSPRPAIGGMVTVLAQK